LKNAIRTVFEDVMMRHKGQRSIKLNDTIVTELNEVKKMLDQKQRALNQQDRELQRKETAFVK